MRYRGGEIHCFLHLLFTAERLWVDLLHIVIAATFKDILKVWGRAEALTATLT